MARGWVAAAALALALAWGCGDAATTDRRGYTKAPLERPGLMVEREVATEMSSFGTPNLPDPPLEPPPDTAG